MELWIGLGVVALLAFYLLSIYNGLIAKRNRVRNAWSQIDVQLKRRHDLIPNLVNAVKGYLAHERGVLESVTRGRAEAIAAGNDVPARAAAEGELTRTVRSLFAVAEAYPDLKANQNFLNLQEELTSSEDRISYARQFYNDTVLRYNTKIQTFPTVLIANAMSFKEREYFEADDASRGPVDVSF